MVGLHGSFLVSPTTFTCAFWEDDELDQFVHIERVEPADYNLGRLWEIDQLVESVEAGTTDFAVALEELHKVSESPSNYSLLTNYGAWFLTGLGFALLLSPNLFDTLTAGIVSLLIFMVVRQSSSCPAWRPVTTIVGAMTSGFIASGMATIGLPINPPLVILSSIIIFIPIQSGSTPLMAFVALTAGLLFSNAFLPAQKSL